MNAFWGRARELEEFRLLFKKTISSLVTCQGRRRIGKSRFIRECGQFADHYFEFSGLSPRPDLSRQQQIDTFCNQLSEQTKLPPIHVQSWEHAFQLLDSQLPKTGRSLVLLDEISWMGIGDPDFAGQIKLAWDRWFSRRPRTVVVLCGSVSSWIEENILNSTGFVGRISWNIRIGPLQLNESLGFWGKLSVRTSTAEKLRILSVTGGIPRYLEEIDPKLQADENIKRLCFHKSGLLFHEFENIFRDIFGRKSDTYRQIVRSLVDGSKSIQEISQLCNRERGGTLSRALQELELSGFVTHEIPFDLVTGKPRPRLLKYRLCDNYLRFYLKYVEPHRSQIESGRFRGKALESLDQWDTILGLQFENLVHQNIETVIEKLGIDPSKVINAGPYLQRATARQKGCQVDLLIQTKRILYLLEIKFRKQIGREVAAEMQLKVASLAKTDRLSIRTGLIYEGTLSPSIQSEELFDLLLEAKELFDK
jgi:uncharacterized protein